MSITDRNKDHIYFINNIPYTEKINKTTIKYDENGSFINVFESVYNDPYYLWYKHNFFSKIIDDQSTDDFIVYKDTERNGFYGASIKSNFYGDRIEPGSVQVLFENNQNPYVLKFTDWNKDERGPILSVTSNDSLVGSLSSGISGSFVDAFTVHCTLRPYPSDNEKCIFHRWTTKDGNVYDKHYGHDVTRSEGYYNTWGVGSFMGKDNFGTYIDFFVYGSNTLSITGTVTLDSPPPFFQGILSGTLSSFASYSYYDETEQTNVYNFGLGLEIDIQNALFPCIYKCTSKISTPGTIVGSAYYEIVDGLTGTFTANVELGFYNYQEGKIANTVDTRYYIPESVDIYDGDYHTIQYVWSKDYLRNGTVLLDGEELLIKQAYGIGRSTPFDFTLTGSTLSATPFSIFGFIEPENVKNVITYNESSNAFFGELNKFVVYDTALIDNDYKPLKLMSGELQISNNRVFFDPFLSNNSNNEIRNNYSLYIEPYLSNVILYLDTSMNFSGNEIQDRSKELGYQTNVNRFKIYSKQNEGAFDRVNDIIYDVKNDNTRIPSTLDISTTSSERNIFVEDYAMAKLYYRSGINISQFGLTKTNIETEDIGIINYNNGILFISNEINITDKSTSLILKSINVEYKKVVDIHVQGDFFVKSKNQSNWYQNGINDYRVKSPTKYINGVGIYDEDGDLIAVAKFPSNVKKTIYDDIQIKIEL